MNWITIFILVAVYIIFLAIILAIVRMGKDGDDEIPDYGRCPDCGTPLMQITRGRFYCYKCKEEKTI